MSIATIAPPPSAKQFSTTVCATKSSIPFSEDEILREFVALVDDLNAAKLTRDLLSTSLTLRTRGKWSDAEILNFEEDSCRSFLLLFRLLYQPNDGLSIRTICTLLRDGAYPKSVSERLSYKQEMLNWDLDDEAVFAAGVTNRELLETFLWGAYAHRCHNPVKRRKFLEWQADVETFMVKKQTFLLMLKMILGFASELSDEVCALLETKATDPVTPHHAK